MSDIYLSLTETPSVVSLSNPVIAGGLVDSVTVTNVVSVNVVTMPAITVQAAAPAVTTVAGTVTISNFPSTQTIAGTVTANISNVVKDGDGLILVGLQAGTNPYAQPISGTVTANLGLQQPVYQHTEVGADRCVLIGTASTEEGQVFHVSPNNPVPISGTVTANVGNLPLATSPNNWETIGDQIGTGLNAAGLNVDVASLPAISGAVTANVGNPSDIIGGGYSDLYNLFQNESVQVSQTGTVVIDTINNPVTISGTVTVGNTVTIAGTVTANVADPSNTIPSGVEAGIQAYASSLASNPLPILGTVAVSSLPASTVTVSALPNGALTTRFGSVTTANTAELTSAVTNASRKYLLVQNIATGTVTIGIGFAPTTTQGIQLTAGAGITFESSYIPTGAVYVLSGVTASNFTVLEA